ncbi:MAG TPA: dephospho-CoA kinase [Melioribacteraceae bacterium]|nr:dephospho-CoA kinase [Melioribacteraceae bacterium]
MKKIKIGITGGIGSGKSIFCKIAESKGYPVIVADEVAKKLLGENEEIKKQIVEAFGSEAYINDEPNKKFLADNVFSKPDKLVQINSIIHPKTLQIIEELMNEYLKTNNLVFVESAIIVEIGIEEMFDYIVLITAEDQKRIERVQKRSSLTSEEIQKRIDSQLKDESKKQFADFTIDNNSTEEKFIEKCEFIITLLKTLTI